MCRLHFHVNGEQIESYKIYVIKVMKQVDESMGLSTNLIAIMNSFLTIHLTFHKYYRVTIGLRTIVKKYMKKFWINLIRLNWLPPRASQIMSKD